MANTETSGRNLKGQASTQPSTVPQKLHPERPRVVWSVAGFDPSSGAGVTADLLTFAAHGLFGCSAITALTVQTTIGVSAWSAVDASVLEATLSQLADDLPAAGVKIGMLGTANAASVVARWLATHRHPKPLVVFDPVLRSSSGRDLYPIAELPKICQELLPHVDWITPNWVELALLAGRSVRSFAEAECTARALGETCPGLHVVVTGGDQTEPVDLLFTPDGGLESFIGRRILTNATHGTGCAFSSALLSQLVLGSSAADAVGRAKAFVEGALERAPGLGRGRGPMDLLWPLRVRATDDR